MLVLRALALVAGLSNAPTSAARALSTNLDISLMASTDVRLSARQGTVTVPPQCIANCNPVNALIAAQCSPQQCCTGTFETEYYNCLLCVGQAANVTDYSTAQGLLTEFEQACQSEGLDIPTLFLPGQGSSLGSATSSKPAGSTRPPTSTRPPASSASQNNNTSTSSSSVSEITVLSIPPSPISQQTVTSIPTLTQPANTPATTNLAQKVYHPSLLAMIVGIIAAGWHLG